MKIWIKNPLGILAKNSDGGLIVDDKKILELIPSGKTPSSNYDSIFDASNHVILPGLINLHQSTSSFLSNSN